MLSYLKDWSGTVVIGSTRYDSILAVLKAYDGKQSPNSITLLPCAENVPERLKTADTTSYRITVKSYMTKKASTDFDFMRKWNNDVPMPFVTMIGTIEKETKGMVYMKLHADIYADVIQTCMKCGKPITNRVSQYFGVGPICGGHNYVNPFGSEEELKQAVSNYRKQLQKVTWEGWIIKSAIIEKEEIEDGENNK